MPRRSCFKPNVEYVLHLCQRSDVQTLGRIRIFRCVICGKQFCWRQREPRIAAFGLDALRDRAHAGGGHEDASICLTECGDGKSPRTLTADAPIRPAFKHSAKSIAPPLWEKLDCFVDGFKRHRSERCGCGCARICSCICARASRSSCSSIDSDEPLFGRAKNHWRATAPIVWIRMSELQRVHQVTTRAQMLDDQCIAIPNDFALQPLWSSLVECSVITNGAINF